MTMDQDLFDAYAQEFVGLLKDVSRLDAPMNRTALLQQANEMLQQMTVEARGTTDPDTRRSYLDRIQVYKSQWKAIQLQADQTELGILPLHPTPNSDLDATLARQSLLVSQAVASLSATEQVAGDIAMNLSVQREQLNDTRAQTSSLQNLTQSANALATSLLQPWWRKGL